MQEYLVLIAPGSTYGPCAEFCRHSQCAYLRSLASATCRICGKPIGYGTEFTGKTIERDKRGVEKFLWHRACEEKEH